MRIEQFDPATEPDKVKACYEMYAAGQPVDDPDGPALPEETFSGWLRQGWAGDPYEAMLAYGDDGQPCGYYTLELPDKENLHLANLELLVTPSARRQGHGAGMLRHAAGLADHHGRTMLAGATRVGTAGSEFATAVGVRPGVVEVRRVLEVASIPAGHLAGLRARAEAAAAGYSLVSWEGMTPEEHLAGMAAASAAMSDAPHNPNEEPQRVDVQRVIDGDSRAAARGLHRYTVAARCGSTGQLAGVTRLAVDPRDPPWGHQLITAVVREHRGHRLGLLVKVAMLELLAEAEPELRRIQTGNADSNQHMIAINVELGFKPLDAWLFWELDLAPEHYANRIESAGPEGLRERSGKVRATVARQ